jgi:hypothetical protein
MKELVLENRRTTIFEVTRHIEDFIRVVSPEHLEGSLIML